MEKNNQETYDSIKSLFIGKKKQASVIALVSALLVFGALLYMTFWAGLPLGASAWSTTVVCLVVALFLAFAVSAYFFVRQYLFRWLVEENETIHYKEKDYLEMAERIYKELK